MPQQPIVYDAPTPEPRATSVEAIQAEILERLIYSVGKDPIVARQHDWLAATILAVRQVSRDDSIQRNLAHIAKARLLPQP